MFCYTGKQIKEKIISDSNKPPEEMKMGWCDQELPGGRRAGLEYVTPEGISLWGDGILSCDLQDKEPVLPRSAYVCGEEG